MSIPACAWRVWFMEKILVCNVSRPYFPRPRNSRRLFSEPTYWLRCSRGQYGEENNQAGIFEAEGNKSLIPGRLACSPVSLLEKRETKALCLCLGNACKRSAGTGSRMISLIFFPPAFANSEIARWIDRRFLSGCIWSPVQVCSASKSLLLHFFFFFKLRT